MNRLLSHALLLLCLAGTAAIVHWAVPTGSWHQLGEMWGAGALALLGLLALPFTAVLFHELAHGAAAAVTGYRIHSICFWAPVSVTHLKLFGVWFVCGRVLRRSGYCLAYPRHLPTWRPILYPAAGPLMTLLLIVGAATAASYVQNRWVQYWLLGVMFINVLYFGSSIVPRTLWIVGRPAFSDGAQVLAALRPLTDADRISLKLDYAWGLAQEGRNSEAELLVAECRAEMPGHRTAALVEAFHLWRLGKLKEALDLYSGCIGDEQFGVEAKAAIALLRCTAGEVQDLARADALSQEILAAFPGAPRAWMTRAYVLSALGRAEESMRFMDLAYENLLDPGERGTAAVLRGHGYVGQGRVPLAEKSLRQALYLGADYSAVRSLARALRKIRKPA